MEMEKKIKVNFVMAYDDQLLNYGKTQVYFLVLHNKNALIINSLPDENDIFNEDIRLLLLINESLV